MNYKNKLLDKINKKESVIGIIGLGYVGLPLAGVFAKKNFNVIGFDIDPDKINMLNQSKSYINHIKSKFLENINKKFTATTNFMNIQDVDVIIICLPTPLTKKKKSRFIIYNFNT